MADFNYTAHRRRPGGAAQYSTEIPMFIQQSAEDTKKSDTRSYSSGSFNSEKPRSRSCVCRCCLLCSVLYAAVIAILLCVYFFVSSPISAVTYSLPEPPVLTGPLSTNDLLTKTEHLMEGEIIGPESLILLGQTAVWTGTYDGRIVEVSQNHIVRQHFLSTPCNIAECSLESEAKTGRPLGMRLTRDGQFLVADAYLGIFRVNFANNQSELLVRGGTLVDGRPLRFLNDVLELSDGTILFTDSSSKWQRRQWPYIILEGSSDGRLLQYHPSTGEVTMLLDGLHFANGIETAPDERFVLVCETAFARVTRYWLEPTQRGKVDVFADNLPGLPDNIRLAADGGFWVGFAMVRHKDKLSIIDALGAYPGLRGFITKLFSEERIYNTLMFVKRWFNPHALIVHLNLDGIITRSLHDVYGKSVITVSEVADAGSALYFGSYHAPFIGRLNIN